LTLIGSEQTFFNRKIPGTYDLLLQAITKEREKRSEMRISFFILFFYFILFFILFYFIRSLSQSIISFSEFSDIAQKCSIGNDAILSSCRFLADLGYVLHFEQGGIR
jgi:hypothetical protein